MPIVQIKVIDSKEVWKSPDGQRTITQLQVETEGKQGTMKTYSDHIKTGFEGQVEVYDKPGKNGDEQFVKMPPKEDGGYAQKGSFHAQASPKQPERSDFTMYLSYAKDLAVALIAEDKLDKLAEVVNDVALAGHQLYGQRDGAPEEISQDTLNNLFPLTEENTVD